jgi:hypothetical protein
VSYRVRTLPWPEVEQFYRDLINKHAWPINPMLELVRFLASSAYSNFLFPSTSHDILCIGRVANFTPGDNELQIQFDGSAQRFRFVYRQRLDDTAPWSRECQASEWHPVLERLLQKRLRWFHENTPAA